MLRKFFFIIAGIAAAINPAVAYVDQPSGLMVFCRVYIYESSGGTHYFTPVFYLDSKAYHEYLNWKDTKSYEDRMPGQLPTPGSYYADAIDGQFHTFMGESKSGLRANDGDCRSSTDAIKIREWKNAQRVLSIPRNLKIGDQ